MFDPRLTVRLFGFRWGMRASGLIVLAVAVGGVISRRVASEAREVDKGFAWMIAAAPTLAVVLCLFIGHEALKVHIWRRQGMTVQRLSLCLFGGFADVSGVAWTPRREAFGAIVAFLALAATAGMLTGAAFISRHATVWIRVPLKTVAAAAVALAVLHVLPALHLDGGHVFHAWFWYLTDSLTGATRAAALYAHIIAAALVGAGVILVSRPGSWPYWGLAAAFAGLQVEGAARRAIHRLRWSSLDTGGMLRDVLLPVTRQVSAQTTLDDVFDQLVGRAAPNFLLVTNANGEPVGFVGLLELRRARRSQWGGVSAQSVMRPLSDAITLPADLALANALSVLEDRSGAVIITNAGQVVSILSSEALLRAIADHARG